jgi:hypothetical protein
MVVGYWLLIIGKQPVTNNHYGCSFVEWILAEAKEVVPPGTLISTI